MHQGVRSLIYWVDSHRDSERIRVNDPATSVDMAAVEQQLGMPLPDDLKVVLSRFNGGTLPGGELFPAGVGPGSIEGELRVLAKDLDRDLLDPELLLPFLRLDDGGLLAFDRAAGPVADTWTVVDYYPDSGATNLVYRTFDSWCRVSVATWDAPDYNEELTVDRYLREARLHADVEPDVVISHATVAHAERRVGKPLDALASYLRAGRCCPPIAWVDWEALKLAVLLGQTREALEAAQRVSKRAPAELWARRETTPRMVADVIGVIAARFEHRESWLRCLDQLAEQSVAPDKAHVMAIRAAVSTGAHPPPSAPSSDSPIKGVAKPDKAWWDAAQKAYVKGALRDEHMLLDPTLRPIASNLGFAQLLQMRRDF